MVGWADVDLLEAYAVYLAFAFVLTIVLRVRYYYALVNTFWDFQSRFPNLFKLVVGNVHAFFAWPHVVSVLAMLALLGLHVGALRYFFFDASVTVANLAANAWVFVLVAVLLVAMAALDVHELFYAEKPEPPRLRVYLLLAEKALATSGIVGTLSEGLFGRILRRKILENTLLVNPWFRRWSLRIAARLAFGLALWGAWALQVV